jgi:hypothetical protein
LKQLLVIPRTPSPSPSREATPEPEEELIDGLTAAQHAQIRSLVRQFASENVGSAKKIKQEIVQSRGLAGRSGYASKRSKRMTERRKLWSLRMIVMMRMAFQHQH